MAKLTIKQALESRGTFYCTTWQGDKHKKCEKYAWNNKAGRYEQFVLVNGLWHTMGFPCSKQTTQDEWLKYVFEHTPSILTDEI